MKSRIARTILIALVLVAALFGPGALPAAAETHTPSDRGTLGGAYSITLGINGSGRVVGVGSTASGTFSISVAATAGGRAFATSGFYAAGTVVTLTATPASGYTFAGWTVDGTAAGSANPFTLTMTANHTVVANFVPSASNPVCSSATLY